MDMSGSSTILWVETLTDVSIVHDCSQSHAPNAPKPSVGRESPLAERVPPRPGPTEGERNDPTADKREAAAFRKLIQHGEHLTVWAAAACEREGIAPTPETLRARIAARLGWSTSDTPFPIPVAATGLEARIVRLSQEILGENERTVFLARHWASVAPDALARQMDLPVTRIAQLEVSARRKIATALGAEVTA